MGLLSGYLHKIRIHKVKSYIQGNVLDLGCGPAGNYELSRKNIEKYYGLEMDEMIVKDLSDKYPGACFLKKDLDSDDFGLDIAFDRILLVAVIEHIFNLKHLFNQIMKYLKKDGKIIITSPTVFGNDIVHRIGTSLGLFSRGNGQDDHISIFNRKRFEVLAAEFGLEIEIYEKFEFGCNQLVVLSRKK